jgi:hypothetical protein
MFSFFVMAGLVPAIDVFVQICAVNNIALYQLLAEPIGQNAMWQPSHRAVAKGVDGRA